MLPDAAPLTRHDVVFTRRVMCVHATHLAAQVPVGIGGRLGSGFFGISGALGHGCVATRALLEAPLTREDALLAVAEAVFAAAARETAMTASTRRTASA